MAGLATYGTITQILSACEKQIATVTGLSESRISLLGRLAPPPYFTAPQDVLLRPGGFIADPAHRDRHDCRVERKLIVVLRTRCDLDPTGQDDQWLTNESRGALIWENNIIDALQNFWPEDDQGNTLSLAPLRVISSEAPDRDTKPDPAWGEDRITFGIPMRLPLTVTADRR